MAKTQSTLTALMGISNVFMSSFSATRSHLAPRPCFEFNLHAGNRNPLTLVMSDGRRD